MYNVPSCWQNLNHLEKFGKSFLCKYIFCPLNLAGLKATTALVDSYFFLESRCFYCIFVMRSFLSVITFFCNIKFLPGLVDLLIFLTTEKQPVFSLGELRPRLVSKFWIDVYLNLCNSWSCPFLFKYFLLCKILMQSWYLLMTASADYLVVIPPALQVT